MKRIAIAVFLLALAPMQAKAFTAQAVYSNNDLMSYVAMPLAVSSVCDVRGVQTDRVGELVGYMNQAEVAPADFVDVFRYVPVALVMRTDRRPDFVEWVHGQVDHGVVGVTLVTSMEHQLGTYSDYLPVSARYRGTRHQRRYAYAYRDVFADDYVPVVVHRYCERQWADPMALIEMPVAVTNVYGLGLPYQRVSSLAIELNLGDVPPVQFVEVFRYAPAALVVSTGYGPDFVQFVHSEQIAGISGIGLVQVIDQRFPTWGIDAQIDLSTPYYYGQNYYTPYAPTAVQYSAQYYVPPVDSAWVPPVVQSRVASAYAAGGANWTGQQQAPAIAAAPQQVQRLLNAPNGGAVVMNPAQARRELARQNRAAREAPVMATGQYAGAPVTGGAVHGRGHGRNATVMANPALAPQVMATRTSHGNGKGHGRQVVTSPAPVMAAPAHGNGNGNGHGRGHAAVAAPPVFAQPQPQVHGNGNGHGHGQGHERQVVYQPPAASPPVMVAPAAVEHGHGHGQGGGPPVAVAQAPAPAPVMANPQGNGHQPPGQEKKKGKGHE